MKIPVWSFSMFAENMRTQEFTKYNVAFAFQESVDFTYSIFIHGRSVFYCCKYYQVLNDFSGMLCETPSLYLMKYLGIYK